MSSIYRKTAKGQAEIETRAHKLPPRLRTALIMVDGKRSDAELRPMLLQSTDETLAALASEGFIEAVRTAGNPAQGALNSLAPATARPLASVPPPAAFAQPFTPLAPAANAPAATPMPVMQPMPVPLPVRKREAVKLLTDQIGPMGEGIAVRIEKARTADDLRSAVLLAAQAIANTRGRQAAERFMTHFADL